MKKMRPIHSREEYMQLRDSAEQKSILAAVRGGNEALKNRLVQFNYSCLPNDDGTSPTICKAAATLPSAPMSHTR